METLKLGSEFRESVGKGAARKLRAQGRVPAVLYGHGETPVSIWVSERDLRKIFSSNWETAIVDLSIAGKADKDCNAIIKEVQQHPTSGKVLHVDFQHIRTGEKIRLEVPVKLMGLPRGVKDMGGILEHGLRQLAVRCVPKDIPGSIDLDVAELGIHDAIHVRDVVGRYPGVEFLDDPGSTLAIVVPPKLEAEPVAPTAEEAPAEPEVIGKGKEAKEGEEEPPSEEKK